MKRLDKQVGLSAPGIGGVKKLTLDNGLGIFVKEDDSAPIVSVQAWVGAGSIHEGGHLGSGLSHFLEHMMFAGSDLRPELDISEAVNKLGGEINAFTSHELTVYHIDIEHAHFAAAADILAATLRAPLFPAAKFAEEKKVILRERDMARDQPMRVLSERLWLELFQVHPMRHPVIGYRDKIELVDRDMMLAYHRRRYSPHRIFFTVVGAVHANDVFNTLSSLLGDWSRGRLDEEALPIESAVRFARQARFEYPDPLARVGAAFHTPSASHPDSPALDLLAGVLGGSGSSTLVRRLRDESQLAIELESCNYATSLRGIFALSAVCQEGKLAELLERLPEEIGRVAGGGVSKTDAARQLEGQLTNYLRGMRSNPGVSQIIGASVNIYGDAEYADKYFADLSRVTRDDLVRVAAKYLRPEMAVTVAQTPTPKAASSAAGGSWDIKSIAAVTGQKHEFGVEGAALSKAGNGARIVSLEDGRLPLVDLAVALPGGAFYEGVAKCGMTGLVAAALRGGGGRFDERRFLEFVDDHAIDLSIHNGGNSLFIRANCRKEKFDRALTVLGAILASPLFDPRRFERERRNRLDHLRAAKLDPQRSAKATLRKCLYGRHPYASPVDGELETVAAIGEGEAREFFMTNCLDAGGAVFGIGGDIAGLDAVSRLMELLDSISWSGTAGCPRIPRPRFPRSPLRRRDIVPREQTVVMVGLPGCDLRSRDRFALHILQTAMSNMASRLFKRVRDERGLAYYTGMDFSAGIHEGMIYFYAGTSGEAAEEVAEMLVEEKRKLADKGLTEDEFKAAKACMKFAAAENRQNLEHLLSEAVAGEFFGNGCQEPWDSQRAIERLGLGACNKTLAKYLSVPGHVVVFAGPKLHRRSELTTLSVAG